MYDKLRHELWLSVWPLLPPEIGVEEKQFVTLLSAENKDVVKSVLKFIKRAMQVRRNLEEKEQEKAMKKAEVRVRRLARL